MEVVPEEVEVEVGLEEEVPAEVDLLLHPPNTDQVQTTIRVRLNRPHRHRHPRPTNIQAGSILISQILNIFNSILISRKNFL